MIRSDEDWSRLIEGFQAAALGLTSWDEALRGLARATGSNHGELIGLGDKCAVPFNWCTDAHPDMVVEFLEVDGADPRVNSRVRVGSRSPELSVVSESELQTEADMRRHPDYGAFIQRHDIPFICLSNLLRRDGLLVGLAVLRSQAQGEIDAEQRRTFALAAPHVRAAVLTQITLQEHCAELAAGTLEALSLAAFVCDAQGRVRAMTPTADALLVDDARLRLREGRLVAGDEAGSRALAAMIHAAALPAAGPAPPPEPLVLRDCVGEPLLVEVAPVPTARSAFGLGAAALVIARPPRRREARVAQVAAALYALTPREAAVVGALVEGHSPAVIAERMGVSVGTIRGHVRRIFEKVRVRSLAELVAAVTSRL